MRHSLSACMLATSMLLAGCTVEGGIQRTYTMEIDETVTSPELDRAIDADRSVPHLLLGGGVAGLPGPRLVALSPAGDVREGLMVVQDARTRSGDVAQRMAALPGVKVTRTIEIGEDEGGEATMRALAQHPVMLARVRLDCRGDRITYLSYHLADAYAGPFAYSFRATAPRPVAMAGATRQAACTGSPAGFGPALG